MNIQILDCAPMSPWFPRWNLGAACVVVGSDQGPILVDTGVGVHDHENPDWIVRLFGLDFGLQRDAGTMAVRRLDRLGIPRGAVRHIVLTHLHFDHAGGLPDFPQVPIPVHRDQQDAFLHARSWIELACDRINAAHGPRWVLFH